MCTYSSLKQCVPPSTQRLTLLFFWCELDVCSARKGQEEAKALLKAALRIRTTSLGPKHLDTADALLKLGGLQREQGLSREAEVLYR